LAGNITQSNKSGSSSGGSSKLSAASQSKLASELKIELSRLLTLCEMLIKDDRFDQTCFLLMFLRRLVANETKTWWKGRTKNITKALKKKGAGRREAHADYAERMLGGLKNLDGDGPEPWSRRESLQLARQHLEYLELGKLKGE
jgi:hypothetical protein